MCQKRTEPGTKRGALFLPALSPNRGGRQEPHCPIQSSTDQPLLTAPFLGPTTLRVHGDALKGPRGKRPRTPQCALATLWWGGVWALARGSLGPCLAMLGALLLTREENRLDANLPPCRRWPTCLSGCTLSRAAAQTAAPPAPAALTRRVDGVQRHLPGTYEPAHLLQVPLPDVVLKDDIVGEAHGA